MGLEVRVAGMLASCAPGEHGQWSAPEHGTGHRRGRKDACTTLIETRRE